MQQNKGRALAPAEASRSDSPSIRPFSAARIRRWGSQTAALAAFIFAAATLVPAARADDAGQTARAVRLSSVDGQVQIAAGGQAITSKAVANMPLFEGYQISTGDDGRAEIQFEDGSVARIAPDSGLTLAVLRGQGADGQAEIVLNGGLGYFELEGSYQAGEIGVRFGNALVTAGGFTVMRVDMDTPPGTLAVFSGNAHIEDGDALTLDLHGGESLALNAANLSQSNVAESIEPNSWDEWNSDRDQALQTSTGTQTQATDNFVNSENPAWNDLNTNGNWYNVPSQGYVWSPYVAANAGWDPYGCGQWVLTPRFGYIWVSCNTWGYMPYQCGTWNFYNSFGWGWSPGMGGCNPWWGRGYMGPNIGYAPAGYRPVLRPIRPVARGPIKRRGPEPILVNREARGGYAGTPLPKRNGPVTIAGHTVEPLHALGTGAAFQRPVAVNTFRAPMAAPPGNGDGHMRAPVQVNRRGYAPAPQNTGRQSLEQRQGRFQAQPSRSYAPPPHYNAAPAPSRAPQGGGYSGGGRPEGGGGGYSGGGSHPSGGSSGGGGGSRGGDGGGGSHGGGRH
ncbi:MAG: DUF6600 domain-containing protein [Terracidiphilus sp.]